MQRQTLETLRNGQGDGPVFNKLRMTVFPKWYEFNHANPVETGTAYDVLPGSVAANATAWNCVGNGCPSTEGSFDLTRFNVSYWQNYERLVSEMLEMGVVRHRRHEFPPFRMYSAALYRPARAVWCVRLGGRAYIGW